MQYSNFQDAIKRISEDADYRTSLVEQPQAVVQDYGLDLDQFQSLKSASPVMQRVKRTPEVGADCCSCCGAPDRN